MTEATVSPYIVRLVMTAQAESPQQAVAMFINELVEKGLVNWAYGVLNEDGETVAELNGHGEDIADLIERIQSGNVDDDDEPYDEGDDEDDDEPAPAAGAPATPSEPPTTPAHNDDDLLALARDLNAGA